MRPTRPFGRVFLLTVPRFEKRLKGVSMGRNLLLAALAVFAAACAEVPYEDERIAPHPPYGATSYEAGIIESRYRSHLYEMPQGNRVVSDPEAGRYELLARTLEEYQDQAEYAMLKVIVGNPPHEKVVGYVEQVRYPQVAIFNRDSGKYEETAFEFNYVRDLHLGVKPRGVILGNGRTILVGKEVDQDVVLGRYSLEVGALLLLHVCPCCGAVVHDNVFLSITRPDIDPKDLGRFKDRMVDRHSRLTAEQIAVENLPEAFWRHPGGHRCATLFEDRDNYAFQAIVPTRLEKVRAAEFSKTYAEPTLDETGEEEE